MLCADVCVRGTHDSSHAFLWQCPYERRACECICVDKELRETNISRCQPNAKSQPLTRYLPLACCVAAACRRAFPGTFIALMGEWLKNTKRGGLRKYRKNCASVSFEIAGPQRTRSPATPFKTNKLIFFYDRRSRERKRGNLERAKFTSDLQPGT